MTTPPAADPRTESLPSSPTPQHTPRRRQWWMPRLDWLLVFVPIAIALRFVPALENPTALFIVSCLAIIPLAGWMGRATEHLAEHLGQGVGGLLNATFGNAAELIIALFALSRGLTGVVKASITGSIIGNVLLVLGLSFLTGGLKFRKQEFNRVAAGVSGTALTLAAIALVIPTVFHQSAAAVPVVMGGWTPQKEQGLSLAIAIILFLTYALMLFFSLVTHRELFGTSKDVMGEAGEELTLMEAEEGAHAPWSMRKSVGVLVGATALVALTSEFLVGAIESARGSLGLTEVFTGVIVVAIVGNAAEHSSAVLMALRNKMDISIGIAIGSSLQIALFVAPLLIFASYLFGSPMNLEFTVPEVVAVVAAIIIVEQISSDGESNWIEGLQLLSVYAVLAVLFYFLPDVHQVTGAEVAH